MNIELLSPFTAMIHILNFSFIIIIVFVERKKPTTAVVWILILSFLPLIGFILYLIFGRNLKLKKKKIFKLKEEYDAVYDKHLLEQKNLLYERGKPFNDIIGMYLNISRSMYTEDNDIAIFTHGKDKYDALLKDIKNASTSIHLLYFIIKDDNIGRKIVDLLTCKARQGVDVRLLYDHMGSILTPPKMFKALVKAGGKVNRFFPFRLGTYMNLNYRNHRKIVVIDGKIGYTGGMNIGDEYMGLNKRITPWRDTHLRITGTSVYFLQERFLMDWYYASNETGIHEDVRLEDFFPPVKSSGNIGMQVVSSGPDLEGEQIKKGFIKMINNARKKLYVETPYFIPDDSFLEALQIAAMSGIDVRIILPSVPDKKFVYRATTSYIKDLMDYGIKVYLYPGFLHAKMLLMDEQITSIGTTNIDIRSFALDFEINTFIYNADFTQKCVEIFNNDMEVSQLVTPEGYSSRSLKEKIEERICRLFSPLM